MDLNYVFDTNMTGILTLENGYILTWNTGSGVFQPWGVLFLNQTSNHYGSGSLQTSNSPESEAILTDVEHR